MFNNVNAGGMFPAFFRLDDAENNVKMSHDNYEVYVNEDYIGQKSLVAQNEKPTDVEDYLKERGFHNFNSAISGNHIVINSSYEETEEIKRNLHVYLNLR